MTKELRKEFETLRGKFDRELPNVCGNCKETDDLHIHHVVPLSNGGRNVITNLIRLCTECHTKAHGGTFALVSASNDTIKRNASQGKRVRGSIPFGYRHNGETFEIDEEEAEVVRFIYRLRYKLEYSTLNISDILNFMALKTVRGASEWKHPTVKRIVDNPRYFGDFIYKGENYGRLLPPILDESYAEEKELFVKKYEGGRLSPRKLEFNAS